MTKDLTTFNKKIKTAAIITSGGVSKRFGSNKLLEEIEPSKTVICATVEKFVKIADVICIPCRKDVQKVVENFFKGDKIIFAKAGETRQESVFNGLKALKKESEPEIVLIHDGARPFVEEKTILETIKKLETETGVCVGVWATDTIKITDENGRITKTVDRNTVFQAQTPQGFRFETIYEAHKKLQEKSFTDDSGMLEYLNIPVLALQGNRSNKKITFREDLNSNLN